jgi:O-antigen/teichoic acid export membrane protein
MPPEKTTSSLKQKVIRAASWTVVGHGLGQALRLGTNLIMTRLLVPEMFGVMAIAIMVTMILSMLSDIGLRQNIVQSKRGDDPLFLDTAWVVQIVRGFALWLVAIAFSCILYLLNTKGMLPVDSVYAAAELPLVIAISASQSAITGFQSTKMATAYRQFNQRRLMLIELFSQSVGLAVMISIASTHPSVWALVIGGLVVVLITTILSHTALSGHANRIRVDRAALTELVMFGKWIFASSAVYILAVSGDRILLGGFVTAELLGLYAIAALIVRSIEAGFSKLLMTVSLPALSEIARSQPARLREIYYRLRTPNDIALLFATGLLFSAGQLVIDFLYDSRYAATGEILQILALSLFSARFSGAQQIYLALGITKNLALLNFSRFAILYTLVPFLYFAYGATAAIWGIALHAAGTIPIIFWLNGKLGLNDFRRELLFLPALPIGLFFGYVLTHVASN